MDNEERILHLFSYSFVVELEILRKFS